MQELSLRAKYTEFTCQSFLLVVIWGQGTSNLSFFVVVVELVPRAVNSDCGQFNRVFCASGIARSRISNENKLGRGDLWAINRLPRPTSRRMLSRDRHVIIV